MLHQVGQLDAIVVPISGGGMCSGVAIVAKALQPGIRIIAAEPRGAALPYQTLQHHVCPKIPSHPSWVVRARAGPVQGLSMPARHASATNTDSSQNLVTAGTAFGRPSQAPVKLHPEGLWFTPMAIFSSEFYERLLAHASHECICEQAHHEYKREGCRPGRNDAADVAASKAEGRLRLDMPKPHTIADGLQGRMGDLTWPIVRDLVDAVVTARPVQH